MDAAHKLSFELHAAEARVREAEAEVAYFRERGIQTESLPVRIYRSKDGRQQTPVYLFDRSPVLIDPALI